MSKLKIYKEGESRTAWLKYEQGDIVKTREGHIVELPLSVEILTEEKVSFTKVGDDHKAVWSRQPPALIDVEVAVQVEEKRKEKMREVWETYERKAKLKSDAFVRLQRIRRHNRWYKKLYRKLFVRKKKLLPEARVI